MIENWLKILLSIFCGFLIYYLISIIFSSIIILNSIKDINISCNPGSPISLPSDYILGTDTNIAKYDKCIELKVEEAYNYSLNYKTSQECLDAPKKLLCSTIIATKTGNISDCNSYNYCYYRLAVINRDTNLCDLINNSNGKDFCYYKIALKKVDTKYCEPIIDRNCYNNCKGVIENARRMAGSAPMTIMDGSDICNNLGKDLANNEVYI